MNKDSDFKAISYFTLEPHAQWANEENGYIPIDEIAQRVYGKPYSSLRGCQRDDDSMRNDTVKLYHLESDEDFEQRIADFDETSIYLGYNSRTYESIVKEGLSQLDYWRSITVSSDPSKVTIEANPPEGADLEGAVFSDQHYADRAFTPSLGGILADLIRRGELGRGNYIFKHWW